MIYGNTVIADSAMVAPNATVIGDVELKADSTVLFNATLRGDCSSRIVVGEGSNIQENCCVHVSEGSDCHIGNGVTMGHGAIAHGCRIGDNTLIGMGAIILDDAEIGSDCLIAAGALVTGGTVIPDGSMVMGSPARVKRALTPEEIEGLRESAREYVRVGRTLVDEGLIRRGKAALNR